MPGFPGGWSRAGNITSSRIYSPSIPACTSTYPGSFSTSCSPDGTAYPEWTVLVSRYPDRFVLGTDLVGHPEGWHQRVVPLSRLLDALQAPARQAVAADNALRLWWHE